MPRQIEGAQKQLGDVIVIVDLNQNFVGGIPQTNNDVRRAVRPLKEL